MELVMLLRFSIRQFPTRQRLVKKSKYVFRLSYVLYILFIARNDAACERFWLASFKKRKFRSFIWIEEARELTFQIPM